MARQFDNLLVFAPLGIAVDEFRHAGIFAALGIEIQVDVPGPRRAQVDGVVDAVVARIFRGPVVHDVTALEETVPDAVSQEDIADAAVRRIGNERAQVTVLAVESAAQLDGVTGQVLLLADEGNRVFLGRQDHGRQNHGFRQADVDDARKELVRPDDSFIEALTDDGIVMGRDGDLINRHVAFIIHGRQFLADLVVVRTGPRILITLEDRFQRIRVRIVEHGYDFPVILVLVDMIEIEAHVAADRIPIEDPVTIGVFWAIREEQRPRIDRSCHGNRKHTLGDDAVHDVRVVDSGQIRCQGAGQGQTGRQQAGYIGT